MGTLEGTGAICPEGPDPSAIRIIQFRLYNLCNCTIALVSNLRLMGSLCVSSVSGFFGLFVLFKFGRSFREIGGNFVPAGCTSFAFRSVELAVSKLCRSLVDSLKWIFVNIFWLSLREWIMYFGCRIDIDYIGNVCDFFFKRNVMNISSLRKINIDSVV